LTLSVVVTLSHLPHPDVIVVMETLNTLVLSVSAGTAVLPKFIRLDETIAVVVAVVVVAVVVVAAVVVVVVAVVFVVVVAVVAGVFTDRNNNNFMVT